MPMKAPSEGHPYPSLDNLIRSINEHADSHDYTVIIARTKVSKTEVKRKIWLRCDRGGKHREPEGQRRGLDRSRGATTGRGDRGSREGEGGQNGRGGEESDGIQESGQTIEGVRTPGGLYTTFRLWEIMGRILQPQL